MHIFEKIYAKTNSTCKSITDLEDTSQTKKPWKPLLFQPVIKIIHIMKEVRELEVSEEDHVTSQANS